MSHVGPCCPCDHRCQRLPDAYAGAPKRSDKCSSSDGRCSSARYKGRQRAVFRDEARCLGIKLNPLGQIRFVSIWGNPRLLQVFKLVHAFRGTGLLAGSLAGWAGVMMIAIDAVERLQIPTGDSQRERLSRGCRCVWSCVTAGINSAICCLPHDAKGHIRGHVASMG